MKILTIQGKPNTAGRRWLVMLLAMHTIAVFGIGYGVGATRHTVEERSVESLLDEAKQRLAAKHQQLIQKERTYGVRTGSQ